MWAVELAKKEALRGRHKECIVGAVLVKGGRVLAKNSNLSRPYGVANRGFHAEERVLRNRDCSGATLIVVRKNKKGKDGTMSRPCPKCWPIVKASGVRKVIYINWFGEITVEKIYA